MRIASTAAPSAPFLSPLPSQRPAASAAASVTRTSSSARLRSGAWVSGSIPGSVPCRRMDERLLDGRRAPPSASCPTTRAWRCTTRVARRPPPGRCSRSGRTAGSPRSTSVPPRARRAACSTPSTTTGVRRRTRPGWDHHDERLVDPRTGRMDTLPFFRRTIEEAGLEDVVVAVIGQLADGRRALGDAARPGVRRRRPRVRRRARRLRGLVAPSSRRAAPSCSTTCSRTPPRVVRRRSRCGSAPSPTASTPVAPPAASECSDGDVAQLPRRSTPLRPSTACRNVATQAPLRLRSVRVFAGAFLFDLDAGGEQLVGVEALGEALAAEEARGGAGAGERVRGEHDRGRVPRRLLDGVELAVEVEGVVVEVGAGPVAAAVGAQELHRPEELAGVVVRSDGVERHDQLARLRRGDPRTVGHAAHAAALDHERAPSGRRSARWRGSRAARRRGWGSTSPSPSGPCRGTRRDGARWRWRARRATAPSRDARGRAVPRSRARTSGCGGCSTNR